MNSELKVKAFCPEAYLIKLRKKLFEVWALIHPGEFEACIGAGETSKKAWEFAANYVCDETGRYP